MKMRINSHLLKTPTQHISHINRSRSRFCFQRTVEPFVWSWKRVFYLGLSGLRFCMFSFILRQEITLSCKVSPLQLSRINGSLTDDISIRFFRHKWLFTIKMSPSASVVTREEISIKTAHFLHVIERDGFFFPDSAGDILHTMRDFTQSLLIISWLCLIDVWKAASWAAAIMSAVVYIRSWRADLMWLGALTDPCSKSRQRWFGIPFFFFSFFFFVNEWNLCLAPRRDDPRLGLEVGSHISIKPSTFLTTFLKKKLTRVFDGLLKEKSCDVNTEGVFCHRLYLFQTVQPVRSSAITCVSRTISRRWPTCWQTLFWGSELGVKLEDEPRLNLFKIRWSSLLLELLRKAAEGVCAPPRALSAWLCVATAVKTGLHSVGGGGGAFHCASSCRI